jgi:hypothetical protein
MRILVSLATYLAHITSPALAGNSNLYGADGSYLGAMTPAGPNNNFIYGSDRSYVGSTAKTGNNTFFMALMAAMQGKLPTALRVKLTNDGLSYLR